jgi:hypothetical protein
MLLAVDGGAAGVGISQLPSLPGAMLLIGA